jgi:cyclic-di-GMP phosphodiesterase, flagellum assembly factor TipF
MPRSASRLGQWPRSSARQSLTSRKARSSDNPPGRGVLSRQMTWPIDAHRFDYALQPVVTLPQRRPRWYEILSRLRLGNGAALSASDWLDAARRTGRLAAVDRALLAHAVPVVRRMHAHGKEIGIFCNISTESLSDGMAFAEIRTWLEANADLKNALVLEVSQDAVKTMGAVEIEALRAISERGFRLSLDQISDLSLDFAELAAYGFRSVKVPSEVMLRDFEAAGAEIHPADLASLLARYGIDLIASDIRTEATVISLLDHGVRFGQGNLFSPPRPLRMDVTTEPAMAV